MPDYLPLCAFRHGLLPAVCRSCAWWQTTGSGRLSPDIAADKRRQWMTTVEATWGTTGLLLESEDPSPPRDPAGITPAVGGAPTGGRGDPVVVGSVSFAPTATLPRLRSLPFNSITAGSALLFCLWLDDGQPRSLEKRLLHKGLGQLKTRGMTEAFAIAGSLDEPLGSDAGAGHQCGLFSAPFLAANGFEPVMQSGELALMRVDLRGLLSVLGQVETVVRRVLRHEPTPSPTAWTHRGT